MPAQNIAALEITAILQADQGISRHLKYDSADGELSASQDACLLRFSGKRLYNQADTYFAAQT